MHTSRHIPDFAARRSIRAIALGVVLSGMLGVVAPAATVADGATFTPTTANQRSIMLVESKEPSSVTRTAAFVPETQNQRSIALIESKEAPGGVLAGEVTVFWHFGDR